MEYEHTHTNKIIYIALGVLLAIIIVLALLYKFGESKPPAEPEPVTPTLTEQMTAQGGSTLTAEEQRILQQTMSASGPSTVTAKERAELKKSMTAQ